jgi:AraC-like DNA-binding protein
MDWKGRSGRDKVHDKVMLIMAAMAAGQTALALSLLLVHPANTATRPLAAVFAAAFLIALPKPAAWLFPATTPFLTAFSLPAHLALAPALWLYVQALTSETPWSLQRGHAWHALPAGFGCAAALMAVALPGADREAMMVRGEMVLTPLALLTAVLIFGLILVWIGQTMAYAACILRRLTAYRRRLQDLFANNDRKELTWISILTGFIAAVWLLALVQVASDSVMNLPLMSPAWLHGLGMLALWAFAAGSLKQKPGFDGRYPPEPEMPGAPLAQPKKYQKSALGPDQAQRIASRINAAMRNDQLYLDPNLSLHKLATHISVAPNTISQTLNETLGESFFAYVNRWRVEAALPLIRTSDQTVLDIALEVGFNSKSAFYKAFRVRTGVTPVQYKAS